MGAATRAITHVAMSVPPGTLTDEYRREVIDFYGPLLGWREIDQLRLPDRMTIAIAPSTYVNVREREDGEPARRYDHFGVLVDTEAELRALWDELDRTPGVTLRAISGTGSTLTFRMQHLLPMAIEIQHFGASHPVL
jgi:hypothetical protein